MTKRRKGEDQSVGIVATKDAAREAALALVELVEQDGPIDNDFKTWLINTDEYDAFESALTRLHELAIPE